MPASFICSWALLPFAGRPHTSPPPPLPPQIPRVDSNDAVQSDAESVAAWFSGVCAPGTNDDGPLLGGGKFDGMCTACKVGLVIFFL